MNKLYELESLIWQFLGVVIIQKALSNTHTKTILIDSSICDTLSDPFLVPCVPPWLERGARGVVGLLHLQSAFHCLTIKLCAPCFRPFTD